MSPRLPRVTAAEIIRVLGQIGFVSAPKWQSSDL